MEKTATTNRHPGLTAKLRGLYAITSDSALQRDDLAQQVELAILGGARLIQYRNKQRRNKKPGNKHTPSPATENTARLEQALSLLHICRQYAVPLIINDDVALAVAISADGVHLGGEDMSCAEARIQLGPGAIIGISCYNQLERALVAQEEGADYVAFGRFFPSRSKPQALQAELFLLQQARRQLQIPIAAIGGITPENGHALIEAGADMLAVIDAVFGQTDTQAAAQRFAQCF